MGDARRSKAALLAEIEELRKRMAAGLDAGDGELPAGLEALRESEQRFQALVGTTADLVAELDSSGRVLYASPSCRELLGCAPEQLVGTRPFHLLHPLDAKSLAQMFRDRLSASGRSRQQRVFRARHRDGSWRWLRGGGVNFRGAGGEMRILCRVSGLHDATVGHEQSVLAPPHAGAPRGTVLVADDDGDIREWLTEVLGRAGFGVLQACDGREAIETFRSQGDGIRLVMLDRAMPRSSGREALDGIRRIRPDVPVVVVSGHSEDSTRRAFAGRRVEAVLRKPVPPDILIVTLDSLLGS